MIIMMALLLKIKTILTSNDYIKHFMIKVNNINNKNNYKTLMITTMILILIKITLRNRLMTIKDD